MSGVDFNSAEHLSKEDTLFDAISVLKRVVGAPNSVLGPDYKVTKDRFSIRTNGHDNALILSNLLSQCVMDLSGHTEKYWAKKRPDGSSFHSEGLHEDTVVVDEGRDEYRVNFSFPPALISELIASIQEKTRMLCSNIKPLRTR